MWQVEGFILYTLDLKKDMEKKKWNYGKILFLKKKHDKTFKKLNWLIWKNNSILIRQNVSREKDKIIIIIITPIGHAIAYCQKKWLSCQSIRWKIQNWYSSQYSSWYL